MEVPPQGSFRYYHEIRVFEADSAAELETLVNNAVDIGLAGDSDNWWIVESVDYEIYTTPPPMPTVKFTVLIHGARAEKV